MKKSILFAAMLLCGGAFTLFFLGYPYKTVMLVSVFLMILLFNVETYNLKSSLNTDTGEIRFEIVAPPFLLRFLTALVLIPFNLAFFLPFAVCAALLLIMLYGMAFSLFCFALICFLFSFFRLAPLLFGLLLLVGFGLMTAILVQFTVLLARGTFRYFAANAALLARGGAKAEKARA